MSPWIFDVTPGKNPKSWPIQLLKFFEKLKGYKPLELQNEPIGMLHKNFGAKVKLFLSKSVRSVKSVHLEKEQVINEDYGKSYEIVRQKARENVDSIG